jgi:hypothetical protein
MINILLSSHYTCFYHEPHNNFTIFRNTSFYTFCNIKINMAKKRLMDWESARRIQSAVDSGRAVKADEGFKSRAMSAAARNEKR